ncbi:Uncharacterised protein [Achromobacter xylosoxidans]|nr:Uncharacterised protein [Achromobacter xylosoxidans]
MLSAETRMKSTESYPRVEASNLTMKNTAPKAIHTPNA